MKEHVEIINMLLEERDYKNVLDLGSGRTSMGILLEKFPKSSVDGICYPGDKRKINSVLENCKGNYNLIEMDICKEQPDKEYDLVMCHLLLGEALKFGNEFDKMLDGVLKVNTKEFCIVDYLEDVDIDYNLLKTKAKESGFKLEKEIVIKKQEEEIYDKFIGKNYIGMLFIK